MVYRPIATLPSERDTREPNFPEKAFLWATQTQCDFAVLIATSKKTMADSRALMAEIDQICRTAPKP